MHLTVCQPHGTDLIRGRSGMGGFPLADHTLPTHPEPTLQKVAQSPLNGTTQPVDIEEEGQSPTTGRKWLK